MDFDIENAEKIAALKLRLAKIQELVADMDVDQFTFDEEEFSMITDVVVALENVFEAKGN